MAKTNIILNTGGFSRQFYIFAQHYFPHWSFTWLTASEVSEHYTPDLLQSVVIVADGKFTDFLNTLPNELQPLAVYYQDFISNHAASAKSVELSRDVNVEQGLAFVVLNSNVGYRKAYYEALRYVDSLGLQPVVLARSKKHDWAETELPTCYVANNFELAIAVHQLGGKLLIADNDIAKPMMQRFDLPRLYIPHSTPGLFEHVIDMQPTAAFLGECYGDLLSGSFTHLCMPNQATFDGLTAVVPYASKQADTQAAPHTTYLIPTGYINLELAISSTLKPSDAKVTRDAIFYCPAAPSISGDPFISKVPVNFPHFSLGILKALLDAFPDKKVIFRHHPNAVEVPEFYERIQEINQALEGEAQYIYDNAPTHHASMARSLIAVTDVSSTGYTFSLSTGYPTVSYLPDYIEPELAIGNDVFRPERQYLGAVENGDLNALVNTVSELLSDVVSHREAILNFRDQSFFNVGEVKAHYLHALSTILAGDVDPTWRQLNV